MGIIDKLLGGMGYAKIKPGAVTERVPLAMAADYQWERDPSWLLQNNDLYTKIGWIFSATTAIIEYGAGVKFSVKTMTGEDEKDIPNHPLEKLLRRPNPLQSRAEFLGASFGYYQLAHNCYWWINKPEGAGEPLELWIIPPGQITPRTDGKLFISHYDYLTMTGETIEIAPEMIVHTRRFNPNNPFQGGGLYETVKYQVNQDYGALRNQAAIQTENNGAPPGILAFATPYEDTQWTRIKNDLAEAARRMAKYLPLRGVGAGGVQWLPNALSDRDMQTIEKRQFTKEELYQIVAPGYLNMMDVSATEANAKTGKATFTEFVIWPMLNAFAEKISNDLLPLYGEDLVGEFDDVRTKDRALELQEMAAYSLTHTVEEVRKRYWMDKPLGDDRDKLMPAQINAQTGDGSGPEPEAPPVMPPQVQQPAQAQEPPEENEGESEDVDGEVQAEVKRWRRVARKCIEQGKAVREFKTSIIPPVQAEAIRGKLATCKTVAEVDAAFERNDPALDRAEKLIERLEQIINAS